MNVLHINTSSDTGGAAIAARRHCAAMRNAGIDANLLALFGSSDDMTIISGYQAKALSNKKHYGWLRHKLSRLVVKRTAWHWLYGDYDISDMQIVKDADIIYIHWINEFLGVNAIESLLRTGKPVVWYMHDMWPITGGCHHSFNCRGYEADCKNCPQMKFFRNLTHGVLDKKLGHWSSYPNLIGAAPSVWLTDCIRNSHLFRGHNVFTIPNVIDTKFYLPKEKKYIRIKFALPIEKKLIIVSAMGYNNPFKGVQYAIQAMEGLMDSDYEFVVVGKCELANFPSHLHSKLHLLGFINNQEEMVDIYNSADVLLITSMAENFPNVVIEAMACGVPVVGFATGGIKDQIKHKSNGWIVEQKDVKGLVEGLRWVLEDADYSDLRKNARQYVLENCSYENVLNNHRVILDLC